MTVGSVTTAAPVLGGLQTKAKAQATSATGTNSGSGSGDSSLAANNLGSTFLSLLVQELKNQDPTQPMDPTAMVGQMISLNQLNQLIGINQALTPSTTAATTGTSTGSGSGTKSEAVHAAGAGAFEAATQAGANALAPAGTTAAQGSDPLMTAAAQSAAPATANSNAPLDLGNLKTLLGGK